LGAGAEGAKLGAGRELYRGNRLKVRRSYGIGTDSRRGGERKEEQKIVAYEIEGSNYCLARGEGSSRVQERETS